MRMKSTLGFLVVVLFALPARAQNPNAFSNLGTVSQFSATSITIKTEAEATETFPLSPNLVVIQNKPATLADIRPNDFIASAAMRGPDGKLHSTELRIFPESMRGLGDGQRPMNDPRNQIMTNATVTGAAVVNGSNNLQVKFQGGESELIVDPGVPVIRMDRVDRAAVTMGTKIRLQGARGADGALVTRITIQ